MDTDLPFLDDDMHVLEIDMYSLAPLQRARQQQPRLTMKLHYMASRLRAALLAWADSDNPTDENVAWWCRGLTYELTTGMALVGHAASSGIFVDIPILLRALSQSMDGQSGPHFKLVLSLDMWTELQRVMDPNDPTEVVAEYIGDWWKKNEEWETIEHDLLDLEAAFEFHLDLYGMFQWHRPDEIPCSRQPPASTMNPNNACQSQICKIRFRAAVDHVKELHTHLRTLGLDFKLQVHKTTRYIQHVKYLKKAYLQDVHRPLTDNDIEIIMHSAGVDPLLTLPPDSELYLPATGEDADFKVNSELSRESTLRVESLSPTGL